MLAMPMKRLGKESPESTRPQRVPDVVILQLSVSIPHHCAGHAQIPLATEFLLSSKLGCIDEEINVVFVRLPWYWVSQILIDAFCRSVEGSKLGYLG